MTSSVLEQLSDLSSLTDVADFLGVPQKQLGYLLRGCKQSDLYVEFSIPKRRGGDRVILAPNKNLKYVQRCLAEKLVQLLRFRMVVHGFAPGRSIVTNAHVHTRKRYVLNVDLKDFFPTINFGRVRGLFLKLGITERVATVLAQIACYKGFLPQGAPTSPIISNLVCSQMDRRLLELAKKHNCFYTRYADDLTFSRRRAGFPSELGSVDDSKHALVGKELRDAIEKSGFQINSEKVWLYDNKMRQTVTGLTVNSKCNVDRRFVRQVRAMIYAWKTFGPKLAEKDHHEKYYRRRGRKDGIPPFKSILRGKLEFIKMVKGVCDPVYRNLQSQLVEVYPEYFEVMQRENSQMNKRDVFISHASEDKASIAKPLADALIKAGFTVWFDEYEIKIGDGLRQKIDEGLSHSKHGIVIISKSFFALSKRWTKRELEGLTAKEDVSGRVLIFPVWHEITHAEVVEVTPTLAGVKAVVAAGKTPDEIVKELSSVLK